jgi:serine/threonine-protein kinase
VHRAGIAHRDVKPANILLAPGDRIVLTDFGLFTPEFKPKAGVAAGTPLYMAPEAFRNQVVQGAINLLDTYAFGVIAFELLTGAPPYNDENTMKVMHQHVSAPIPEFPTRLRLPPRLTALVTELLAKDPRDRPQSMEAVAGQLRAIRDAMARTRADSAPRVLVVDDTPELAKLMAMYVKLAVPGAEVQTADGAKQALELIRKKQPEVLLLDLTMPEMSGVELFMYLRGEQLCESTTVIAVSAGARDADLQLLHDLGVSSFISKGPDLRSHISSAMKELFG